MAEHGRRGGEAWRLGYPPCGRQLQAKWSARKGRLVVLQQGSVRCERAGFGGFWKSRCAGHEEEHADWKCENGETSCSEQRPANSADTWLKDMPRRTARGHLPASGAGGHPRDEQADQYHWTTVSGQDQGPDGRRG